MTEAEWLAGKDPEEMLDSLSDANDRKLRLFACVCCRRISHLLSDVVSHQLVALAEARADGVEPDDQMVAAVEAFRESVRSHRDDFPDVCAEREAFTAFMWLLSDRSTAWESASQVRDATPDALSCDAASQSANVRKSELMLHAQYLRDIFGNPFRPVAFSPELRTTTAVAIAQQMYESRDFSAMPILADALQDACCDNDDILNHCRDANATHVRGCWVVDLVLGKE